MNAAFRARWCFVAALVLVPFALPSSAEGQQPKLDIKLFAGASGTTYVSYLESGRERDTFAGWQIGFGARVRKRRWFVEALLSFNRSSIPRIAQQEETDAGDVVSVSFRGRVNSFELPIHAGFVPYKNAFFKLFLYAGYVNHFNTSINASVTTRVDFSDPNEEPFEETVDVRLRPREADLAVYQAIARFGVNFDLAALNFDFNYSISMNSASSTSYRTGYHQIQINLAYLF